MTTYTDITDLIDLSMALDKETDKDKIKIRADSVNRKARNIIDSGAFPKINEKLMELIQLNMKLVEANGKIPEPVAVLFYHPKYPECYPVVRDWIKTKTNIGEKIKMLAVDCSDPITIPLYQPLGITTFPTVMVATDGILTPFPVDVITPATITTYFTPYFTESGILI